LPAVCAKCRMLRGRRLRQHSEIRFQVTLIGGIQYNLNVPLCQHTYISELRSCVANVLQRDPAQVRLIHGTRLLLGSEVIGDVFGDTMMAEVSAVVVEIGGGPVEDLLDAEDPVTEYAPDVFKSWRERELRFRVETNYMDTQMELTKKMRAILVDWLVDVHMKWRLHPNTLYLTIHLIDRYLQKTQVPKNKLQLVGVACMSIAAKFAETGAPPMIELSWVTDHAYQPEEIAGYEMKVLGSLNFNVLTPVALEFLLIFQKANRCSDEQSHLTQYILELSLGSMELVGYTPSHLAAASVLLSNKLLKVSPNWSKAMVSYTGYESKVLTPCAKTMCGLLDKSVSSTLQATRKKFLLPSHGNAARIVDSLVQP